MTSVAIKTVVFTFLVPGTVAGVVPAAIRAVEGGHGLVQNVALLTLGTALLTIGAAGYVWCAYDFVARGHGTPAPLEPPKFLVRGGLYRCARNPMYVSVVSAILGQAALFGSPAVASYGLVVAAAFHGFVVFYEEPKLRKLFGDEYDAYCAAVRRWGLF